MFLSFKALNGRGEFYINRERAVLQRLHPPPVDSVCFRFTSGVPRKGRVLSFGHNRLFRLILRQESVDEQRYPEKATESVFHSALPNLPDLIVGRRSRVEDNGILTIPAT